MSKYTTGEIAKLCGVTVRTVQYYDTRGILVPSQLSEGGRRLYSEDDLQQMKVICFLRDMGLPINSIAELLSEEHPEHVIHILLAQQKEVLKGEIGQRREKLEMVEALQKGLKASDDFSVESIGDIAYQMENKKKLRKVRIALIAMAIPLEVIEIAVLVLGISKGIWWPFFVCLPVYALLAVLISKYYLNNVAYICPECHKVFKPAFKEAFWAKHTPTTRKLTCTECGHKGFCVETYGGDD